MNIREVRAKYPQYSDLSDEQLAESLHAKFYADMPYSEFARKIGARPPVDESVLDPRDAQAKKRQTVDQMPFAQFLQSSARASMPGRALQGAVDVVDAGAQMLSRLGGEGEAKRVDEMVKERERGYQQARADVGQSGMDVPRALGAGAVQLATLGRLPPATSALGKAASIPTTGALYGLMQPVTQGDFATEKAKQAGAGAIASTVAAPLAAGLSRIVSPKTSPQVKTLMDAGITPTPGQILGGGFRSGEEKAKSIPILGQMIRGAEDRATASLNDAAWNRVLSNIGGKLPKGVRGNEAVAYVDDAIGANYDRILDKIGAKPVDQKLIADVSNLGGMVSTMREDVGKQYSAIVKQQIADRLQDGKYLTGDAIKAAESELRTKASQYMRGGPTEHDLGAALMEARTSLRDWLTRVAPEEAKALQANNKAYAEFLRPLKAAGSLGAQEGVFTAAQLQNAVKAADPSKHKKAFARGDALMQDLSSAAKDVMTAKVPNSGTTDRGLAVAAPFALASAVSSGAIPMAALPAGAAAMGMYTGPGQRAMAGLLARRPEGAAELAEVVGRSSPALMASLFPVTYGLLHQ